MWPPSTLFPDLDALVRGMQALVDIVGVEHVGLGSDMLGFLVPVSFGSYRQLPSLREAMAHGGFAAREIDAVLGDNYARVFTSSMHAVLHCDT